MYVVMGSVFGMLLRDLFTLTREHFAGRVLIHMAERSDLYSQFMVDYNTTKYGNLLERLNTHTGWNTEMGDMVLAGIATHLGRVIVVFTINNSIILSPLEGKVDERLSPLLVAYVRNSHFMHVKPKSQLQQFGESAEAEGGKQGRPQRPHTPPMRRPSIGVGTDWLRRLKLHGQNHTKCTQLGPCKKIVFHRLCFLEIEY